MPTRYDLKQVWKWVPYSEIQDKKSGIQIEAYRWTTPGFYNIDYNAKHKWSGNLYTRTLRVNIIQDIQQGKIVLLDGPIAKDPKTDATWPHPKGGFWREFMWDLMLLKHQEWFEPVVGPLVVPPNKPILRDGYPNPFYAQILGAPFDIDGFPPIVLDLDKT